jgi:hypothetical protein
MLREFDSEFDGMEWLKDRVEQGEISCQPKYRRARDQPWGRMLFQQNSLNYYQCRRFGHSFGLLIVIDEGRSHVIKTLKLQGAVGK